MAWPSLSVKIAYGSVPFSTNPTFNTLSTSCVAASVSRGRRSLLEEVGPGDATLVFENGNRRWSMFSTVTTLSTVGITAAHRQVRVATVVSGTTYRLFTGFTRQPPDNLTLEYDGRFGAVATVKCYDLLGVLATISIQSSTGFPDLTGQDTGARISFLLAAAGVPTSWTTISTGYASMQGTTYHKSILDMIREAEMAEGGLVWVDRNGKLHFDNRLAGITSTRIINVATTYTSASSRAQFSDIAPSAGTRIINRVTLQRTGGQPKTEESTASQDTHGPLAVSVSDLKNQSDNDLVSRAEALIAQYKDPHPAPASLSFRPMIGTVAMTAVYSQEIHTKVRVKWREPARSTALVSKDVLVEGITHEFAGRGTKSIQSAMITESAQRFGFVNSTVFWTLNSTSQGQLDENKLAY